MAGIWMIGLEHPSSCLIYYRGSFLLSISTLEA